MQEQANILEYSGMFPISLVLTCLVTMVALRPAGGE